jgi:hypothetical protein
MTVKEIIDQIEASEFGEKCVRLTPFSEYDPCIIGCWLDEDNGYRLIYSTIRLCEMLVAKQGMSDLEAAEFHRYNIEGARIGPGTPIYADEAMNHPQETVVTQ